MPRGRPAGSKNKKKPDTRTNLDSVAKYHANIFIARAGINIAEKLARKILKNIHENKERIAKKKKVNPLY